MSEKCPVCGEPVKVVGGETKHYESTAQKKIAELSAQVNELRYVIEDTLNKQPRMATEVSEICNALRSALDETKEQSLAAHDNEVIESMRMAFRQAFMAGQIDCGIDPSHSSAEAYADVLIRNLKTEEGE